MRPTSFTSQYRKHLEFKVLFTPGKQMHSGMTGSKVDKTCSGVKGVKRVLKTASDHLNNILRWSGTHMFIPHLKCAHKCVSGFPEQRAKTT